MEIVVHVINQSGSFYKDPHEFASVQTVAGENSRAEIFTAVTIGGSILRIYAR